jgi:hypothetical protein
VTPKELEDDVTPSEDELDELVTPRDEELDTEVKLNNALEDELPSELVDSPAVELELDELLSPRELLDDEFLELYEEDDRDVTPNEDVDWFTLELLEVNPRDEWLELELDTTALSCSYQLICIAKSSLPPDMFVTLIR